MLLEPVSAGYSTHAFAPPETTGDASGHHPGSTRTRDGAAQEMANRNGGEERQLAEMKRRDQQVRRHEQAHLAAAGSHAIGGPTYHYHTGPDGRRYAVGGEVSIDLSVVAGDPEATVEKMRTVRRAALAPMDPSPADRAVAARAYAKMQHAQAELQRGEDAGRGSAPVFAAVERPGLFLLA